MFETNVGGADRVLRIVAGIALLALFLLFPDAPWRWVGLVGLVPLATALLGSCPLYTLFGISTCRVKRA